MRDPSTPLPATAPSLARRVLCFPLTRIVLATVALIVSVVITSTLVRQLEQPMLARDLSVAYEALRNAARLSGVLAVYLAFVRWVERRKPSELSLRGALPETAAGVGIAFVLISTVMGLLALLGYYRIVSTGSVVALVSALAFCAEAAVIEEIAFRGVLFRITEEALGTWIAVVVSALFFGFLHLVNDNATWFSSTAIVLEAGLLLAAAYAWTKKLWLPIGLHLGWNLTEGGVFGARVSGYESAGLFRSDLTGPTILTGGDFGPEASLITVLLCLTAGVIMMQLARRKGHIVRPYWARLREARAERQLPTAA